MKKIALLTVSLAAALVVAALTAHSEDTPADDAAKKTAQEKLVQQGKQLVEQKHCSICHAIDGNGGKKFTPMNGMAEGKEFDHLKGAILDPKKTLGADTKMIAYKFSDDEVRAIIEYIKTLKKPEPPKP